MSLEENKTIVRRFIHEGVIGGNLGVIDELCSPECINHAAVPEARHGAEGAKRVVGFSRAAMPDQRWTNEMLIAEGDLVVIHGIREATWQADSFRGVTTPKGKAVAVELVHIFRVRDGTASVGTPPAPLPASRALAYGRILVPSAVASH